VRVCAQDNAFLCAWNADPGLGIKSDDIAQKLTFNDGQIEIITRKDLDLVCALHLSRPLVLTLRFHEKIFSYMFCVRV